MIVQKSRYIRTHVVGGGGIIDTIANIVKRITGNTVGDLASKLLVSTGTSMASEAGKRLVSRFIAPPSSAPPTAPQNAASHQAKPNEIMSKYAGSGVATHDQAITIKDLVRKMHQGSDLEVI
jgi:hypothetical protein